MTPDEKIAKDACDYLFRIGKHANAAVEFNPVGYLRQRLAEAIAAEREACAKIAEECAKDFLSPGYAAGQPLSSFSERFACKTVAAAIRART